MEAIGVIKSSENQYSITNQEQVRLAWGRETDKAAANTPPRPEAQGRASKSRVQAGEETTKRVAEAMDKYVRSIQSDLEIKIHEETGKIIVKVISHETGEVIREIPSEEMLKLAERMEEMAGGLLRTTA